MRNPLIVAIVLIGASTAALADQVQLDLAARDKDIHWPAGFQPQAAQIFAHNRLQISASCSAVWDHIVDAKQWPSWYPNSKDVRMLEGAQVLGPDVRWLWTTFGLSIESKVHEDVLHSRLGWYGYAPGTPPAFYHTWLLRPQGEGCLVTMEEAGLGATATQLHNTNPKLMHRGHDLWLATLKWVSEGP